MPHGPHIGPTSAKCLSILNLSLPALSLVKQVYLANSILYSSAILINKYMLYMAFSKAYCWNALENAKISTSVGQECAPNLTVQVL